MTTTCSSGSISLAARSTPKPSPLGSFRSVSTTTGRACCSCCTASGSSRASTTAWPCASRACRSMARSESLSSTMRTGSDDIVDLRLVIRDSLLSDDSRLLIGDAKPSIDKSASSNQQPITNQRSPGRQCLLSDPASGRTSATSVVLDLGDVLGVLLDFLLGSIEVGECLIAIRGNLCTLLGYVALDEVGVERVDAALQRFCEALRPVEQDAFVLDALAPLGLFLLALRRVRAHLRGLVGLDSSSLVRSLLVTRFVSRGLVRRRLVRRRLVRRRLVRRLIGGRR